MKNLFMLMLVLLWAAFAAADCCKSDGDGRCDDGVQGDPCCGYGPCNIFCCNCEGGCRTSSIRGRPSWEFQQNLKNTFAKTVNYEGVFELMDTNKSDDISLGEYLAWVAGTREPLLITKPQLMDQWIDYFSRFDANGDGRIQRSEMEKPYRSV